MSDWITKLSELREGDTPAAIVTIISCKGSTARKVGTKMLVDIEGNSYGTVGGGSIEAQAIQDARNCIQGGQSKLFKYIANCKSGHGCGGSMDVFRMKKGVVKLLVLFVVLMVANTSLAWGLCNALTLVQPTGGEHISGFYNIMFTRDKSSTGAINQGTIVYIRGLPNYLESSRPTRV